ncbi:MAG: isoprenylcysteine carboxylmethyltransferase family protein [Bacteroidota bacterium]
MKIAFLLPLGLLVLCLIIRSVYELLKEAKKINPESKPIFAFVFTSMCVLWVSWFVLCLSDPYQIDIPSPLRWLGLVIFIAGSVLAIGALIQLKGVENIDHLVTTRLFRKIRHPMYVGFICWIVGWSIYHSALASLAVGLIGIASILWWRHLEEGRLEEQFGSSYQHYRHTTWF